MRGVTINIQMDKNHNLSVDLKDILDIVGERGLNSVWVLSNVDVGGKEAATELHRLSDNHIPVDGRTLLNLAREVWQVIDGEFEAFENNQDRPWLVIYAVDSSAFDVVTEDNSLLEKLAERYKDIEDLPPSALE